MMDPQESKCCVCSIVGSSHMWGCSSKNLEGWTKRWTINLASQRGLSENNGGQYPIQDGVTIVAI